MFAVTVCTSARVEGVRLNPRDLHISVSAPAYPSRARGAESPSPLRR